MTSLTPAAPPRTAVPPRRTARLTAVCRTPAVPSASTTNAV
ncbi:hypothetical protein [Streptomyces decoyicus]